jgi:hypothetical protein
MGIGLAVLEPLSQRENGRDAGSHESAQRERPGASARETGTDPGGWHGRRATLTASRVPRGLRRRVSRRRADRNGNWAGILGRDRRSLAQEHRPC